MINKSFSMLVFVFLVNFSTACFFDSDRDNPNDPRNINSDSVIIPVPADLTIGTVTTDSISISWNGSENITGYRLYRSSDDAVYTELTTVSQGALYTGISYTDTGLTAGTTYYYKVSAYNNEGESDKSASVYVSTLSDPATLTLGTLTANSISMSWGSVTGAVGYRVYRSSDGIAFTQISGDIVSATDYTDTGLTEHIVYYYAVTSYNSGGESAKSNSVAAATLGVPIVQTTAIAGNVSTMISISDLYKIPLSGFIAGTSARGGGYILSDGGATVTDRGVCWSTSVNPTTSGDHTSDGAAVQAGAFTNSVLTGLTANTVYHVRAYAGNSSGTAYGEDISFNSGHTFGSTVSVSGVDGLVFYNDGTGHGMVCAAADQTSGKWIPAAYQTSEIGSSAQGTKVGTGQANTAAIIATDPTNNNAAYICTQVGSGWFLPSKDELACIYANLRLNSLGSLTGNGYYSSSEYNAEFVWCQDFNVDIPYESDYDIGRQLIWAKSKHSITITIAFIDYTISINTRAVSSF